MEQIAVIAYWLSLAALAGATVLYAYHFTSKRPLMARLGTAFTGAGFLLLTASIGLMSSETGGTVLTGPNSIVLMAWALVLVYFMFEHLVKIKTYGIVLIPVALALLVAAQLMGVTSLVVGQLTQAQKYQLEDGRVGIHVLLIVIGSAGFIISGIASGTYLVLEGQLKKHRTSKFFKRLPSLAQTDTAARTAAFWGYPAYTAALLLGVIRAIETDVAGWWSDIVVMIAGLVWAVFGAYLFLRTAKGWGGRGAAYLAIGGAVLVIVLRIVSVTVGGAGVFHVFGGLR